MAASRVPQPAIDSGIVAISKTGRTNSRAWLHSSGAATDLARNQAAVTDVTWMSSEYAMIGTTLDAEPNTLRAIEAAATIWRVSHQRSSQRQWTNPSAKNTKQAPMLPKPTISNAMR